MILIIGAGPIGIEMAVELSRCKVPFRIVEAGSTASTIEWYAPGTEIFSSPERISIAGIPFEPLTRKAYREDYLLYLRNVVRQFKLPIEHFERRRYREITQKQFYCFDRAKFSRRGRSARTSRNSRNLF